MTDKEFLETKRLMDGEGKIRAALRSGAIVPALAAAWTAGLALVQKLSRAQAAAPASAPYNFVRHRLVVAADFKAWLYRNQDHRSQEKRLEPCYLWPLGRAKKHKGKAGGEGFACTRPARYPCSVDEAREQGVAIVFRNPTGPFAAEPLQLVEDSE